MAAKFTTYHPHHSFNASASLNQNPDYHSSSSLALQPSTDFSLETSSLSASSAFSFYEPNNITSLSSVKSMHTQMIKRYKFRNTDVVAKSLILCYLEFGDFKSAAKVFLVDYARSYVEWRAFLEEYENFGGTLSQVLEVVGELHGKGVIFKPRILTVVLKICSRAKNSWLGLNVHASLIKRGLEYDVHLNCALMNFHEGCWNVDSANNVFKGVSIRENQLWNEAIVMNLRNERWRRAIELFSEMQFSLAKASSRTIVRMLQSCSKFGGLDEGKKLHGYVYKFGLESDLFICNSLIVMYSRNEKLELARIVFDSMKDRDISSWNSMISSYTTLGYVKDAWDVFDNMESSNIKPDIITWNSLLSGHIAHGSYVESLTVLRRMQALGFRPDASSVSSLLQAVTELGLVEYGQEIHGYIIRNQLDYDVYVETSLLDMYVKNDRLDCAETVFGIMKNRNIVAWNLLISGYSTRGRIEDTRKLLSLMEEEGVKPDLVTWNSLVSGYSVSGHSKEALDTIYLMKESGFLPDVVSWTSLISGSSKNEKYIQSFKFFNQMQQEGIKPNSATLSTLLRTCGSLGLLQMGEKIHSLSVKNGFLEDVYVTTALIDMYSKSGNLEKAYQVFLNSANKTLVTWNCMIMGLAIHSQGKKAISLFHEMSGVGVEPDDITFTALLSACKNSGLIDEGWKYFDSMSSDYNITPTVEHYSCMVDLLGKAGYLDEAWDFIQTMPLEPDATIWGAFLSSCQNYKNIEFAEIAANRLFQLEPYNSSNYVLMMSLYAMSSRWDDVENVRDKMADAGVKNGPVWSWIQINDKIHMFNADGKLHPDTGEIYFELFHLVSEMKKLGYTPDTRCVYQNIEEVEKEKILMSHTEKLAITYGLMKTESSVPIWVIKNTRVCSDCHTAAKYMSLVGNRDIFIREGTRFHHFREGKCSCDN